VRPISYAQNGEDLLLARAFPHPDGFYIDVGANDPADLSVTKFFSDRGWTGVNVEPQPAMFDRLVRDRPRDVNLNLAVTDRDGATTLYESSTHNGWTTVVPAVADRITDLGVELHSRTVPTTTLAAVCETYAASRTIDFLSIDVEGAERAVLAGADFRRFRPRVVLVESIGHGRTRTHAEWEPILLAANYRFAWFDGINNFYVRGEEPELLAHFDRPANPYDDPCVPWEFERQLRQVGDENNRLRTRVNVLEAELATAQRDAAHAARPFRTRLKRLLGRAA
jgi:FkbM family methyltransferase